MLIQNEDEVLRELQKIVGENYATNDPAIRIGYSRDQVLTTEGPEYVVAPETKEEIQEVMRFATKRNIPVLPKGTGANMGGLVIPLHKGIILDLKRMNKIEQFDEKNMTVIVGPGVTYGQLQIEAWNRGMFVVVPSGPHSVKVIANICGTRGIGHYAGKYALGDNQIIGMEIVLPNGDLLNLGSFAHGKGELAANFAHGPGPDLMGMFLGGFGTIGVITKIKVKLYPKLRYHELLSIGGKLDLLFDEIIKLVKMGYSNGMLVRWPYVVFLFAKTREEHFKWLENQMIEGFILQFIEGTQRDFEYHVKKIKTLYKKRSDFTVGTLSDLMKFMSPVISKGGKKISEDDQEYGYIQEPRKLHDFMYQSVRILRTHGGFAPHCPFFSLRDARGMWTYMKDWVTKIGGPINETCCYLQIVDDGHSVLQEMDLEFDPDPNKMLDNLKTFIGIGKPMMDTMFVKMNGIQYYFYSNGEIFETIGPVLIPGFFYVLKKLKTLIDPLFLMNRGRGIRPEGVDRPALDTSGGGGFGGGLSMGAIFWLQTLASVINELNYPEKDKMKSYLENIKSKNIGDDSLQEILAFAINSAIKILLAENSRATPEESIGQFFQRTYKEMVGEKIVIKSNFHDLWMIEFGALADSDPVKVYPVDKKAARKKPSILTDYIFTRKALMGEEVDPLLSMLQKNVGTFSIMHAINAWIPIIQKFSDMVMIATITLLYKKDLLQELKRVLNKKIESILSKL